MTDIQYSINDIIGVDSLIEELGFEERTWTPDMFADLYETYMARFDLATNYLDGLKNSLKGKDNFPEKLGETLRLLQSTDLTQKQIAEQMNYSTRNVSQINQRSKDALHSKGR